MRASHLRLYAVLFMCAPLSAIACDPEARAKQSSSTSRALPAHSVIASHANPLSGRQIQVRLAKPIGSAQLRELALKLKGEHAGPDEHALIFYFLPEMVPGTGAWATTHFEPGLSVRILGLTSEQDSLIRSQSLALPPEFKLAGEWIDHAQGLSSRISLIERGSEHRLRFHFADGSVVERRLRSRGLQGKGARYDDVDSGYEEHYVVYPSGVLELWDDQGSIRRAMPLTSGRPTSDSP